MSAKHGSSTQEPAPAATTETASQPPQAIGKPDGTLDLLGNPALESLAKALDDYHRAKQSKSDLVEFVVHTTRNLTAAERKHSASAVNHGDKTLTIRAYGFSREKLGGKQVLQFATDEETKQFVEESIVIQVENPDGTYLGFGNPIELMQGEPLVTKSPPLAAAVADLTRLMIQQNEMILRVTGHNKTDEFRRWEADVQRVADWVAAEETAQAEGGE